MQKDNNIKNLKVTASAIILAATLAFTGCYAEKEKNQTVEKDYEQYQTNTFYIIRDNGNIDIGVKCKIAESVQDGELIYNYDVPTGIDADGNGIEEYALLQLDSDEIVEEIEVYENDEEKIEYLNEILSLCHNYYGEADITKYIKKQR